jgi:hypothetical protein
VTSADREPPSEVDPFDLPEWLGEDEVTWSSEAGVRGEHVVPGCLVGTTGERLACDLFAVDEAYPAPVVDEATRTRVHQAWRHGQVLVVQRGGRLTLALPGRTFATDLVLDALTRLAKAVGAEPTRWSVHLRLADRD